MKTIYDLNALALASRLKNLSETMYADVSKIYEEKDVDFEPRWFPVFYLLKENGHNRGRGVGRSTELLARIGGTNFFQTP